MVSDSLCVISSEVLDDNLRMFIILLGLSLCYRSEKVASESFARNDHMRPFVASVVC